MGSNGIMENGILINYFQFLEFSNFYPYSVQIDEDALHRRNNMFLLLQITFGLCWELCFSYKRKDIRSVPALLLT